MNKKWLICLFLCAFLLVITPPVFSQIKPQVKDLVQQSKQYHEAKEYSLAIEKLQQAIKVFEEEGDRENLAISLTNLSRLYLATSQLKEAKNSLEESLKIFESQGNSQQYIKNLTTLANLQLVIGEADKALNNFEKITNIYQESNNKVGFSNSLIYQALAMNKLGLASRACPTLIEALTFELDNTTINQGKGLCQTDNDLTPEELGLKIHELVIRINNLWSQRESSLYLNGLRNLGKILRQIGKVNEAEIVLKKNLEIIEAKLNERGTNPELSNNLIQEKAATLITLGNTFRTQGTLELDEYAQIEYNYQPWQWQSLNILDENKVCKIERVCQAYNDALEQYQQALLLINSKSAKIKARVNYLTLLVATEDTQTAIKIASEINSEIRLANLPLTESLVFAKIKYAQNLAFLKTQITGRVKAQSKIDFLSEKTIENILNKALEEAKYLENNRAQSYALGNLAGFYEQQGKSKLETAKKLTQEALYLAQPSEAPDLAYQWQWQLARLLTAEGKKEQALSSYAQSSKILDKVKKELLTIDADVEFSFRKNLTPFYYQYLDLLLEENATNAHLEDAITVLDSFQKAELANFLRCNLDELDLNLPSSLVRIDEINASPAAIIYPILLGNRLEIIVKVPSQISQGSPRYQIYRESSWKFAKNQQSPTEYSQKIREFTEIVENLKNSVSDRNSSLRKSKWDKNSILPLSQKLYDWLIKPIEKYLPEKGTLVFVLDINSGLQNIPLAVLHDGEDYLIKKYSIAVSLSPQLPNPKPLELRNSQTLLAGIYEKADSFPATLEALDYVKDEVKNIGTTISSQVLENKEFNQEQFQNQINANSYSIIHLATHGQFHSNPNQTVIYAWDKKINVNTLGNLLQQKTETSLSSIELLVLSACQTATGNKKAPLGIAGIALRAGASSTLASLWQVNDEKTAKFMTLFYQELQKNLTLAEALRQVQLSFINDPDTSTQHPYYWAAFILAGNWL